MRGEQPTTIFIDLDDTLVDTFGLLITPLERTAAEAICQIDGIPLTPEHLTSVLLELRKRTPAELRVKLGEMSKADADRVLPVRDQVFADFSIDELAISSKVMEMLRSLALDYRLVLVTEGRTGIQEKKLRQLDIGNLFDDVLIVDPATGNSKEAIIKSYVTSMNITPKQAVIVGNRLDREIIAGKRLGIPTIWIRAGEGSEAKLDDIDEKPNVVIDDIEQLASPFLYDLRPSHHRTTCKL